MKKKFLLLGLIAAIATNPAFSEKISRIDFVGADRIDAETILSYIPVDIGDEFDDDILNECLKSLNSTGFFEEVRINMEKNALIINVKEYPVINKISFEGNSKIKDVDIKKTVKLKSREVLSPTKVKDVQNGLLESYRKMGIYNASVNPKIIKLDNNRVNLVFEINEGDQAGIDKIIFIGNKHFSSESLREIIYSKVKKWYRFFVTDDIYDSERLEEDKRAILKFYREQGFATANVVSAVAELSDNKKGFNLIFTVDEGDVYNVGDVKIQSNIKKLSEKDLDYTCYTKKGDVYNETLLDLDASNISRKAGEKGWASVIVAPETNKDEKSKIINATFTIEEGQKVYISKIFIKGNTRTRDHVIRREILLEEGDAFNRALSTTSESNLRNLGFFKSVSIETTQDPNSPDKCILEVNVEEAPTGEAMISASYSTSDGPGLDLSYNEKNFFGTGKYLSLFLGSSKSRTGKSYKVNENGDKTPVSRKSKFKFLNNVSMTVGDPHLFDKDIDGSMTFHRTQAVKWDGFSSKELGVGFDISYALTSKIEQGWGYNIASRKFNDVSEFASPIIKYQVMKHENGTVSNAIPGKHDISSIRHTISYGKAFYTGLKGSFRTGLTTSIAGLGADAKHLKNDIFSSYSFPVLRKSVIKLSVSAGLLSPMGGKGPHLVDSYSLGLDSFRGFEDCGVGPRSETTRLTTLQKLDGNIVSGNYNFYDYIGAKKYWKGTAEFIFPLGLPEDLQFRGFIFSDFGQIWDAPDKGDKYIKYTGATGILNPKTKTTYPVASCSFDKTNTNILIGHKILDKKKLKASAGLGIAFVTPFGPMKFTYAVPVRREKHDETHRFLVSFSTIF